MAFKRIDCPIISYIDHEGEGTVLYFYFTGWGKYFSPWWEVKECSIFFNYIISLPEIKNHPSWEEDISLQIEEYFASERLILR